MVMHGVAAHSGHSGPHHRSPMAGAEAPSRIASAMTDAITHGSGSIQPALISPSRCRQRRAAHRPLHCVALIHTRRTDRLIGRRIVSPAEKADRDGQRARMRARAGRGSAHRGGRPPSRGNAASRCSTVHSRGICGVRPETGSMEPAEVPRERAPTDRPFAGRDERRGASGRLQQGHGGHGRGAGAPEQRLLCGCGEPGARIRLHRGAAPGDRCRPLGAGGCVWRRTHGSDGGGNADALRMSGDDDDDDDNERH